jgi:hypothetical protein
LSDQPWHTQQPDQPFLRYFLRGWSPRGAMIFGLITGGMAFLILIVFLISLIVNIISAL